MVHIQSCRLKQIAICMPLGEKSRGKHHSSSHLCIYLNIPYSWLQISVFLPLLLWPSKQVKVRAITAISATLCQADWEVAAKTKERVSNLYDGVCDSVVLADGCLDHLLDGWRRKTTAAWGRTVDGEAPPGLTEPPSDPIDCLDSCVKMPVIWYEHKFACILSCVWMEVILFYFYRSVINIRMMFHWWFTLYLQLFWSLGSISNLSGWVCVCGKVHCLMSDPKLDSKGRVDLKACDSLSWSQRMCDRVQVVSFSNSSQQGYQSKNFFHRELERTALLTSLG